LELLISGVLSSQPRARASSLSLSLSATTLQTNIHAGKTPKWSRYRAATEPLQRRYPLRYRVRGAPRLSPPRELRDARETESDKQSGACVRRLGGF